MTGSSSAVTPLAEGSVRSRPPARVARLHTSSSVRAVFATRCASGSSLAVVHARLRGDQGVARATVIAGKAVGNAVARNRVKRRLRGALAAEGLPPGADYVVVGRTAALTASSQELREVLRRSARTALARCS